MMLLYGGFSAAGAATLGDRVSLGPVADGAGAELLVHLAPHVDPQDFARVHGLVYGRTLRSDPSRHVFAAKTETEATAFMERATESVQVASVYRNERTDYVKTAFVPNDPLFTAGYQHPGQWHLINPYTPGLDAGVEGAWNRDITGSGVVIGVIDDCIQSTHPDLAPNYVAAHSWDFGDGDPTPDPANVDDDHGVSVAGVACARGGNWLGVTGAAPYAGLAGLRIDWSSQSTADFVDASLYHSSGSDTSIAIKNHSYSAPGAYGGTPAESDAIIQSAAAGTIHVMSAGNHRGNSGEDCNKKDTQSRPELIVVAAVGSDGTYSHYSNFGSNVCCCATSSTNGGDYIVTTDRTGEYGYNCTGCYDIIGDFDYTGRFSGTSSAAPLVSGVLALAKEVQPALDVRFAKHLLARTCKVVDPADSSVSSGGGWVTNAAGYHFNCNYGFGLIDADELTLQAVQYTGVTAQTTESTGTVTVDAYIPDNDPNGPTRTFTINATEPLEEVLVHLTAYVGYRGDLQCWLTSPSGTTSRVLCVASAVGGNHIDWTYSTHAFWGENPAGTWTIEVEDVQTGWGWTDGTWNTFEVTMRMGDLVPVTNDPPIIVAAESRKTHGSAGTFAVDVASVSMTEPRVDGPTEVVVTFDQAIEQVSGTVADVQVTSGTVTSVNVNGAILTVGLNGVDNGVPLTLGFGGIATAGQPTMVVTETLCFGVVQADVAPGGGIDIFDLLDTRNVLTLPVSAGTFRADTDTDGDVDIFDLLSVRNRMGDALVGGCP